MDGADSTPPNQVVSTSVVVGADPQGQQIRDTAGSGEAEPIAHHGPATGPWLPSTQVPDVLVRETRYLERDGMLRVLADPANGRQVVDAIGRRFDERFGDPTADSAEHRVLSADELLCRRLSLERTVVSGAVQYMTAVSTLSAIAHDPQSFTDILQGSYLSVEPGYPASWLDDEFLMHGRDGYPREGGQHAFMQAAVQQLTAGWDTLSGSDPAWMEVVDIKDERTNARAALLESVPPELRRELDLPAHRARSRTPPHRIGPTRGAGGGIASAVARRSVPRLFGNASGRGVGATARAGAHTARSTGCQVGRHQSLARRGTYDHPGRAVASIAGTRLSRPSSEWTGNYRSPDPAPVADHGYRGVRHRPVSSANPRSPRARKPHSRLL